MTKSNRMKRIVTLNEVQKSIASQRLSDARTRHDANLKKLEDFRRYRQEYSRALQQPGTAMVVATARDTRVFLDQLDKTIAALEAMCSRSERECERELGVWKKEAQRTNVLTDILGRCMRGEEADYEGRLQREIDDRRAVKAEL